MSQVMTPSRPSSTVPKLPEIQHPLARLSAQPLHSDRLDVRGLSRSGRPMTSECGTPARRMSGSRSGGDSRMSAVSRSAPGGMGAIPEGVEVMLGDPSKTKLPIFGNKAEVGSRAQSRLSQIATERLDIDELESVVKEKVKNNYYEMRKRFCDNDPEQKGNITRDALLRILVTACGRPISSTQLTQLLQRIGIRPDKSIINFTEFFSAFRLCQTSEYPRWMDPVQRHHQDKVKMSAEEVHRNLQEKIRQRFIDLADVFPQFIDGGTGRLLKPELRNALNKMLFFMDDSEFEKLWRKYDTDNSGAVSGIVMLRKMGITMRPGPPGTARRQSPPQSSASRQARRHDTERQRQLDVEHWLKEKFRSGFYKMRDAFQDEDENGSGLVSVDAFLRILKEFGLSIEKRHLPEFLARCVIEAQRGGIPYRDFLHRFQDRSDAGMAHKVLSNPHHGYHGNQSTNNFDVLESQMLNMFQRDFLTLLGTFQKCDRWNCGVISPEEFRAAIEARFELELADDQFSKFMDRVPLNADGMVKYDDFMKEFDTRGLAPSLFHGERKGKDFAEFSGPEMDTSVNRLVIESGGERRTVEETRALIKEIMDTRYQELERAFYEIDELNSQRLTQEMMHSLLQKMHINPPVTRGEIRDLWKTFILNERHSLEFKEFVRSFIYDVRTSSFPNAKVVPPRRGDSDFMMRSRKLNCASDMLQDNLRSKIDYMWERLRMEFVDMDPYATGFVSREEFQEVLRELCVQLSDYELQALTSKFDIKKDGRVSYAEFLKPFAQKRQVWRHGNNMLSLLQHPQQELPMSDITDSPSKGPAGITSMARQKITSEWKTLRRAFKKLDAGNTGFVGLPEFRSVLHLANIVLSEEEVFQLMSEYDENLSMKIPYNRLLDEFKPIVAE